VSISINKILRNRNRAKGNTTRTTQDELKKVIWSSEWRSTIWPLELWPVSSARCHWIQSNKWSIPSSPSPVLRRGWNAKKWEVIEAAKRLPGTFYPVQCRNWLPGWNQHFGDCMRKYDLAISESEMGATDGKLWSAGRNDSRAARAALHQNLESQINRLFLISRFLFCASTTVTLI
jgi:hypothetical protein